MQRKQKRDIERKEQNGREYGITVRQQVDKGDHRQKTEKKREREREKNREKKRAVVIQQLTTLAPRITIQTGALLVYTDTLGTGLFSL